MNPLRPQRHLRRSSLQPQRLLIASMMVWGCVACMPCAIALGQSLSRPRTESTEALGTNRSLDSVSMETDLIADPPAAMLPRLSRVAPVFIDQCVGCHNDQQAEGGYSMATPQAMWRTGASKRLPITSNPVGPELAMEHSPDADYGELFRRLVAHDSTSRMPKDGDPLDWDTIETIRQWIATGAHVDGGMDAPIESFLPWSPPNAPRYPSYPKPHAASAIAIHPNQQHLFVAGFAEILVWSVEGEPRLLDRLSVRGRFISDIEWNAGSQSVCVASGEPGRIGYVESLVWTEPRDESLPLEQFATGTLRQTHWVCRDVPIDIAVQNSGERLAIGNADGTVVAIDLLANRILWKAASHAAAVTSVDWSDDGKSLVSSSRDRTAKIYQAEDGSVLHGFADHERTVGSIRFLRRGLASWDEAGTLRWFPNATTSNAKVSRSGLHQQTAKILTSGDTIIVPANDSIRRFQLRREEVVDSKDEEGKEKKKTNYYLDDAPSLSLLPWPQLGTPIALAILRKSDDWIAAGFADGHVMLWSVEKSDPVLFKNQPQLPRDR